MLLEDVERAREVPEVLRERACTRGRGVHEVEVAGVLVGRVPVGALAEAPQVGRQHHIPADRELMGIVAVIFGNRPPAGVVGRRPQAGALERRRVALDDKGAVVLAVSIMVGNKCPVHVLAKGQREAVERLARGVPDVAVRQHLTTWLELVGVDLPDD